MYNYNFENVTILHEFTDKLVTINDTNYTLNIIITNKNILFFKNNTDFLKQKTIGVCVTPEYDLVLEINNNKFEQKNDKLIINYNNNIITIFDIKF